MSPTPALPSAGIPRIKGLRNDQPRTDTEPHGHTPRRDHGPPPGRKSLGGGADHGRTQPRGVGFRSSRNPTGPAYSSGFQRVLDNFGWHDTLSDRAIRAYRRVVGRNSEEVNESYVFKYKLPNNLKEANIISKQFNPELSIAKLELEQANKDVAIAKSDLSPSATLSFQATQTDDTSSTYDESDKETLKATVSWPFSLGGKNLSSLRKNKSLRDQKALLLEDAKRSNEALVSSAWSNFKSSKSLLNSIRVQVKAAEIANEGISIEYESGHGRSTLDVIQSNSILLDAKNNLATSRRNHFLSQYKLLLTLGQLTALNLNLN